MIVFYHHLLINLQTKTVASEVPTHVHQVTVLLEIEVVSTEFDDR